MDMKQLVENVRRRILESSERHKNTKKMYLAYSGGSDSALMLEAVKRTGLLDDPDWSFRIMSINTQLYDKGHVERVNADIERFGYLLYWYTGKGLTWYVNSIMENGFGYTPSVHVYYYRMLKERAIDKSIKDYKSFYHERILCLTGVRRAESLKRANTPFEYHKKGSRVTLNVIADLSNEDKDELIKQVTWWQGKPTEDCGCNWHGNSDLNKLNDQAKKHIIELNTKMKELGLWGYGEEPTKEQRALFGDVIIKDEMPEDSFCISCVTNRGL